MTSIIKGFRGDNCHCCPEYILYAPTENDPAEPHDARTVGIINELSGEGSLTEEIVTEGIGASVSVSADGRFANGSASAGSRRIQINATSTGGPWTAGVILWDDSGFSYDPSLRGSISHLKALASVRLTDEFQTYDAAGPAINFGPVIEQDGTRYYAADSTVSAPGDACWTSWQGKAEDTAAPHHAMRIPKIAEGRHWTSMPGKFGRCDSWFFESDGAGSFDVDASPDISFDVVSRPITKFGIWIALTSDYFDDSPYGTPTATPAGTYSLDVLIDNLYLEMETWGVYRISGDDVGNPYDFGTTLVDEDLTTIPSWTNGGLPIIDSNGESEQCWNMDTAKLVDGFVGQDAISGGNEYDSFRIGSAFSTPPTGDNFQLTIDFTWHTIRDRDHVNTTGSFPPGESRRVEAGIWIDKLFRFTVWREGSDQTHDCGSRGFTMTMPVEADGGSDYSYFVPGSAGTGGACDYSPATGTNVSDGQECGVGHAQGFSRPMGGDRITIIVRKVYTGTSLSDLQANNAALVAGGITCLAAVRIYPESRYYITVFINGRMLFANRSSLSGSPVWGILSTGQIWFPGSSTNFGMLGLCGGRLSDFKIRSRS